MKRRCSREVIPFVLVALTVATIVPSAWSQPGIGVGCSVIPQSWGQTARNIQQGLDSLFFSACSRHDSCYRVCNNPAGPYKQWGWKAGCDATFLADMVAACGAWSLILSFPNDEWADGQDFMTACSAVATTAVTVLQTSVGANAFLTQQAPRCNAWANGGQVNCLLCGGLGPGAGTPDCELQPWHPDCPMCPITVDLQGNGIKLSGRNPPAYFDLDGDGFADHTSWTREQTKDGFLVLDRNGNGKIDDGRELFGNATPLLLDARVATHGYEALAEFDNEILGGNANGEIDPGDRIFEHLRLWLDKNRDTLTQPGELFSLSDSGIEALAFDYTPDGRVDQWGNEFRWKASVYFVGGSESESVDVFFKRQ